MEPQLPPHVAAARDAEQLRMLAVGHFVLAGLALLGLAFIGFHQAVMHVVFDHPEMWKNAKGGPPPALMLDLFRWVYVAFAAFFIAAASATSCPASSCASGAAARSRWSWPASTA
ncbi:MAG: hypothetical protein J0L88_11680 [Xanthomonadales bacterium]|nr:hypothetical protein [Xanthomonadales bacterium]